MLRLLIFITINLGIVGCSNNESIKSIDEEFTPYVAQIEAILGEKINTNIYFSDDLEKGRTGQCRLADSSRDIQINSVSWQHLSENSKIALLAHEILHCIYGLKHVAPSYESGIPDLMSPYTSDSRMCVERYGLEACIEEALSTAPRVSQHFLAGAK